MKKLTILLYLLSCSAGSIAQDLLSPPGPDEKNRITSYGLVENDSDLVHGLSDLVHGLLELEGALVGSSPTEKDCSQFDNDEVEGTEDEVEGTEKDEVEGTEDEVEGTEDEVEGTEDEVEGTEDEVEGTEKDEVEGTEKDEVEGTEDEVEGTEKDSSQFDNDRVTLLLRPKPMNPLDIQRFIYQKYESEFEEGEGVLDPQQMEEELFNHIVWAPRIWRPWDFLLDCDEDEEDEDELQDEEDELQYEEDEIQEEEDQLQDEEDELLQDEEDELLKEEEDELQDEEEELQEEEDELQDEEDELQENDSEFLQSETVQSQTRDGFSEEQGFFRISQFIWDPGDPLFFLYKDPPFVYVFSDPESLADEEMSKELVLLLNPKKKKDAPSSTSQRWFSKKTQEKHFEFVIDRQRWLITNSSLSNGFFRSNTPSESYQYLSNLFLSNRRLLDQMTKTLFRKKWLFPDEMKIGFM